MRNTTTLARMRFLSMKGENSAPRPSQRDAGNGTTKGKRPRQRGQTVTLERNAGIWHVSYVFRMVAHSYWLACAALAFAGTTLELCTLPAEP